MNHTVMTFAFTAVVAVSIAFAPGAVKADAKATLGSVTSANGYNFTNATVTASVTMSATGAEVVLKKGSTEVSRQSVTQSGSYVFNLPELTLCQPCGYTVELVDGSTVIDSVSGTHVAANVTGADGSWVRSTKTVTTGGAWSPALTWGDTSATVYDSTFTLAADRTSATSGKYVVLDTAFGVSEAIYSEDLSDLDLTIAQGALALVDTNGAIAWKGYVGGSWVALSGVTAETGSFVARVEFDYRTATPKIRYSLSSDNGSSFTVLKSSGTDWLSSSHASSTTVTSVEVLGNVSLTSLDGTYRNTNLASVNGTEYATLSAALGAGDPTLLTNVSWVPDRAGNWTITSGGCGLELLPGAEWSARLDGTSLAVRNGYLFRLVNGSGATNMYCTAYDAFAAVSDDNSTVVLTNDVSDTLSAVVSDHPVTFDLAGNTFIGGTVSIKDSAVLTVTNSTDQTGHVSASFEADTGLATQFKIAGGKWTSTDATAYASNLLTSDHKFIQLAETETEGGVTFAYEAKAFAEAPSADSKVYPTVVSGAESISVVVPDSFVEKHVGTGKTASEVTTALSAARTTGNKMTLMECNILNLDPDDAASVPVAVAKQSSEAGKIVFSLGSLSPNAQSGVNVKFAVEECDTPNGTFSPVSGAEKTGTHEFSIDKPSTVKYYKVAISYGN